MEDEKKPKNCTKEEKCNVCGRNYNKIHKVKDKKLENNGGYPGCEFLVNIKLKKWKIPFLLYIIHILFFIKNYVLFSTLFILKL